MDSTPPPAEALRPRTELDVLSEKNIGVITAGYASEAVRLGISQTPEAALAAVEERRQRVEQDNSLRINMTAASLTRFLEVGKHETYWDAVDKGAAAPTLGALATHNHKAIHENYTDYRAAAEVSIARYAPEHGRGVRPHYAAITGANPKDKLRGPSPIYGNWWVELPERLSDEAVYNFSDSHAGVRLEGEGHSFDPSTILNGHDALTAQAIKELSDEYYSTLGLSLLPGTNMAINADPTKFITIAGRGVGYIEALVFEDIRAEEIPAIGTMITKDEDLAEAGELIKAHPELLSRISSLYVGTQVPRLARDWLVAHVDPQAVVPLASDAEQPESSVDWASLGIDPSADYVDVARSIHKKSVEAWKAARPFVEYKSPPHDLSDPKAMGKWDGYIKSLRASSKNTTGATRESIDTLIELQKARVFFNPSQGLVAA